MRDADDMASQLTDEDSKRLRELEAGMAALRERTQGHRETDGKKSSMDVLAERIEQRVAASLATRIDPTPAWMKLAAAVGGLLIVCITIGSVIWGASESRATAASANAILLARVTNAEGKLLELLPLMQKVQVLEINNEAARRDRDRQMQGTQDRLRVVEVETSEVRERNNSVLQLIATLTSENRNLATRMEEMLRRQERLENRLGARQGSGQTPDGPTALRTVPLLWWIPAME